LASRFGVSNAAKTASGGAEKIRVVSNVDISALTP
jgi:hypothetical protein